MAETAVSSQVEGVVGQYLSSLTQNVDYLMSEEMARRALRSGNMAEIDPKRRTLKEMEEIFGLNISFPEDLLPSSLFSYDGVYGYLQRQEKDSYWSLILFLKGDGSLQRIEIIDMPRDRIFQTQRTILVVKKEGIFQATLSIGAQNYNLSLGVLAGNPFADGGAYQPGSISGSFDFEGRALSQVGLPFD